MAQYPVKIDASEMESLRPVLAHIAEEEPRKRGRLLARQVLKKLEGFRDWVEDQKIPFRQVWMTSSELDFLKDVSDSFNLDIEAARHWRRW